jgi:GT2 family glycosyltransferase
MTEHVPAVSVVMPARDAEPYVRRAIDSILSQTFADFEFVIVDDGSTDRTADIVAGYAMRDPRVALVRRPHSGVAAALNEGCRLARGRYLARMDADDVSVPTRLERQVAFLDANREVGILGGNIHEFTESGPAPSVWRRPTEHHVIGWFLLFGNPIAHPTVAMRRDVFERVGPYRAGACEDYDLWLRAFAVTKMANLPSVLVEYCIREDQVSRINPARGSVTRLQRESLAGLLGSEVDDAAVEFVRGEGALPRATELELALSLLLRTHSAYRRRYATGRDDASEIALDVLKRLRRFASVQDIERRLRWRIEWESAKLASSLGSARLLAKTGALARRTIVTRLSKASGL